MLAWLIPAVMGLMLGVVMWLDGVVPYPEYVGPEEPCYVNEQDDTVCPEGVLQPATPLRRAVTTLSAEAVYAPFTLLGLVVGLGLSITVLVRARKTRHEKPDDRLAFRIALAAVLLLIAIPMCAGLVLFAMVASFRIRG